MRLYSIVRLMLEDPDRGFRDWLAMFGGAELTAIAGELESAVRPTLFRDGRWYIDYRRLRIAALPTAA